MSTLNIGLSPLWLFEDTASLTALLEQELDCPDLQDTRAEIVRLVSLSRQVAVRKTIAAGIADAFSTGETPARDSLRKLLEKVTGLSTGQANRILNGLGIFSGCDRDSKRDTSELIARVVSPDRQTKTVIPLETAILLALAGAEEFDVFIGSPPRFAATVAALILRARIAGSTGETEYQASQRVKREFPPLPARAAVGRLDQLPIMPSSMMACYGLYLWQAAGLLFSNWPGDRTIEALRRGERWAEKHFKGLMPDAKQPQSGTHDQHSRELSHLFRSHVYAVAEQVGKALCGLTPYTRPLPKNS